MKRSILLAAVLTSFSSFAWADGTYAKVGAEWRNGQNSTQDSMAYSLALGQSINNNLDAELYTRIKSNDDDTNNTRLEGALIAKASYGSFTPYVRGAVGEKLDGQDNHSYWSVEPGVKYAVLPGLRVKGALRFRDAFTTSNNDSTRTYRLGAEYDVTKSSTVALNVDKALGDSEYVAVGASYGIKF